MVSNKHAFWQALIVAVAVFALGLAAGFFLESYRADSVRTILSNVEIQVLDEQLRQRSIEDLNASCALAEQSIFDFADRIYLEALKLEQYEGASKFGDSFLIMHRRYDLLRTMLWGDSIRLRERCPVMFHTVVYLYEYNPQDVEVRARQSFYSRLLADTKEAHGSDMLLIPIATNMDLSSLDLMLANYNISDSPLLFIDERHRVDEVITVAELESLLSS
ncbi:MAG TPA: hypothetical protein VJK03_01310 [Candidatus Nanoarchaeia archaeon]|nr:hypothetical protein [Candidatus Nanoarchaeia archaeon]